MKADDLALLVTNHDMNHIFADYLRDGVIPDGKALYTSADQSIIDAISECEQFVTNWAALPPRKLIDLYSAIKNRLSAFFFEIEALKAAIRETVNSQARLITDDYTAYSGIGSEYAGGHESVCHRTKEYVCGDVHTNTAESSFAILKRGIMGIYHNVSKDYLHRYVW